MATFTYDDAVRRESLLDILKDVSPVEDNYLMNEMGSSTAKNTLHEWPVFNISRPTSVTTKAEGADFTEESNAQPTRSQNITSILSRSVRVSGTEMAMNPAGMSDVWAFQQANALRKLKADMEYLMLNGTGLVSGASGTARNTGGINAVISTNLTARNSGTSMSTTELEDILQNSWDAVGSEYVAKVVLCPMGIKRKIAGFTTRVTPFADSTTGIYNNIGTYESSSGLVKIVPHKDVINSTGSTHVYALNIDMFKAAYLREPFYEKLAKVGDAERGQYVTELTLESRAERASVKRLGYALLG